MAGELRLPARGQSCQRASATIYVGKYIVAVCAYYVKKYIGASAGDLATVG